MKNTFILLLTILLISPAVAQFKNPSEEKSKAFIASKTLYVEDNFDGDEQKEWFKKYWRFEQDIQFVKRDQLEKIVDEEQAVAFLTVGERNEVVEDNQMKQSFGCFMVAAYMANDVKKWDKKDVDSRKKKEIFKLSTASQPYDEYDFKFLGDHFYNYMSKAEGKNADNIADRIKIESEDIKPLTTKTLLVAKESTEMTEAEIKEVYPYPFKLVDSEYIAKSILDENPDEAYIKLLFSDVGFGWAVFTLASKDGKVMNKVGTGGISFSMYTPSATGKTAYHSLKPTELKKSHFKTMAGRVKKAAK